MWIFSEIKIFASYFVLMSLCVDPFKRIFLTKIFIVDSHVVVEVI